MDIRWTTQNDKGAVVAIIHGIPVRIFCGQPTPRGWILQIGDRKILRGSKKFLQAVARHNVEKMINDGYESGTR